MKTCTLFVLSVLFMGIFAQNNAMAQVDGSPCSSWSHISFATSDNTPTNYQAWCNNACQESCCSSGTPPYYSGPFSGKDIRDYINCSCGNYNCHNVVDVLKNKQNSKPKN